MTSFSPVTGYSPSLEPTLGTAPTTASVQFASSALPNAGVPTGFDPRSMMIDSSGRYIQPPVTDMGVAGPAATPVDPGLALGASAPVITPGVQAGSTIAGGPLGLAAGASIGTTGAMAPGWNADYGNAFARAFVQSGVSPSTTSAALHTLAAGQPTTAELDQALQYLSSPQGAQLAPYLADNLARQAPGYAALGSQGGPGVGSAAGLGTGGLDTGLDPTGVGTGSDPTGGLGAQDPTAYPPSTHDPAGTQPTGPTGAIGTDPTGTTGSSPTGANGTDPTAANGPLAPGAQVGTDAQGNPVTVTGQDQSGNYTLSDGSVIDPQGNVIQNADGTNPSDTTKPAVDPQTGLPVDPAAAAGADQPPASGNGNGGGSGLKVPAMLIGTGIVSASLWSKFHNHNGWSPLGAFKHHPTPTPTPTGTDPAGTPHGGGPNATDPVRPGDPARPGNPVRPGDPHTPSIRAGAPSTRPLLVTDDEAGLQRQYEKLVGKDGNGGERGKALQRIKELQAQPYNSERIKAITYWQSKVDNAERAAEKLITDASPEAYTKRLNAAKDKLADVKSAYESTKGHPDVKGPSLLDVQDAENEVSHLEGTLSSAESEASKLAKAHVPLPPMQIAQGVRPPGAARADAAKGAVTHAAEGVEENAAKTGAGFVERTIAKVFAR